MVDQKREEISEIMACLKIQVDKLGHKIDEADRNFTEIYQCIDAIRFDFETLQNKIGG